MNHLIIGNKNYSSWSLRPWLLLKEMDIPFSETKISLYKEGSKEALLKHSASGKVPVFNHNDITIWDSLAICEYISDLYPHKDCWPSELDDRACARAVSHEMHSSFFNLREMLPMNCRKKISFSSVTPVLQTDIDRIREIWCDCRKHYEKLGPFLFGAFSIADAMYAPVVLRFDSYGIDVGEVEKAYMKTMLGLVSMQEWIHEGVNESETIENAEIENS